MDRCSQPFGSSNKSGRTFKRTALSETIFPINYYKPFAYFPTRRKHKVIAKCLYASILVKTTYAGTKLIEKNARPRGFYYQNFFSEKRLKIESYDSRTIVLK